MKVTVLGGASFSTPAIFAAMRGEFVGDEFVLVGRSQDALGAVTRASQMLAGELAPTITPLVRHPESSADALRGADVVVLQMRIGNMRGRDFDEAFPLSFGLCGDEGLGPGGASAAWRAWPIVEEWLGAIHRHAPEALVLMLSSPVGILTRAALEKFPKLNCLGICEVPYVALREMCQQLHVNLASIHFDYLGVNHIGWLYGVRSENRDLVREWANLPQRSGFPPSNLIQEWGGLPTKYLRLHFDPTAVITAQRSAGTPRAQELQKLQESALSLYATASEGELRQSLARRETPWYADSLVPLLRGLREGDAPGPFFLSGRNGQQVAACATDDVLEIGCRAKNHVVVRIPTIEPPPTPIAMFVSKFCRYERLATTAVLARDATMLERALSFHPWVERAATTNEDIAAAVAGTIVAGMPSQLAEWSAQPSMNRSS